MTGTDPTAGGLLRAIAMHPDEDTPRLIYADWLQENGDEARAEFIRGQCERARTEDPECLHCWPGNGCLFHALQRRELELLWLHEAEWRRPPCPTCDDGPALFCNTCESSGSCGPLSRFTARSWVAGERNETEYTWKHPVTWVRGFPTVACRLEEVGYEKRSWVDGTMMWLTTPWALAVVRTGGTFEVTDREPFLHLDAPKWGWARGRRTLHGQPENVLPPVVWDEIPMVKNKENVYDTPTEAKSALNAAVHRLVVRAAYPQGEQA